MIIEYIVWTTDKTFKTFYDKTKAIRYAKRYNKEVWQDNITRGGLIVDSICIYPSTIKS